MGWLADKIRRRFEKKRPSGLQADIRMISGCEDAQTSADVSSVAAFKLPDPAGRAGGACTSTLLNILYKDEVTPEDTLSYVQVLDRMREDLSNKGFSQIPQLCASQPIDVNVDFDLVPTGANGKRRAVMVGINYVGMDPGELSGCHNDVKNMKRYITQVHGFDEDDVVVLMDDGDHDDPTKENILNALKNMVAKTRPGDCLFFHYSGHGAKLRDTSGDEKDGYDETLVPLDYQDNDMIRDDDLYEIIVKPLPYGSHLFCLFDCCHSGTVLDLPYQYRPGTDAKEMIIDETFDFNRFYSKFGADAPNFDDDGDDDD